MTPFARQFADLILRLEGRMGGKAGEELRLAATLAAELSLRGQVCVDLPRAAGKTLAEVLEEGEAAEPGEELVLPVAAAWRRELASCRTVAVIPATGETPSLPLVLDGHGRLYLHRMWRDERLVADKVGEMAGSGRFSVITGGPGTGKTTHAARLLAEFAARGSGTAALAAPTGKAAARLSQAVERFLPGLSLPQDVLSRIPRQAQTLHRLLGWSPGRGLFMRGPGDPLPFALVVVDEASMAPLSLTARLLEALPPGGRLVLLGDRDQLASVEAGAVLADLCAGAPSPSITVLTSSWRFDPARGIGKAARAINAGDGREGLAVLRGDDGQAFWRGIADRRALSIAVGEAVEGFRPFCEAASPADALRALEGYRLLAALREGTWGAGGLNVMAAGALAGKGLLDASGEWHHRRPVLVTANDYGLGLFNGDLGVVWREGGEGGGRGETRAHFPAGEGTRSFRVAQLPPVVTAFALTVHRSQGSEFGRVALVLPDRDLPVLTRELVYTAITRARDRAEVWGTEEVFLAAVARRTERSSGLRDALWDGLERSGR